MSKLKQNLQNYFWLRFSSWMIACLCQAMSLDQDDETIYADFNADAYNDLIEYQFNNIVKLMSGLGMGESIQEKVLKELSANLASLMVVENWGINDSDGNCPTISSQSDTPKVKIEFPTPLILLVDIIGYWPFLYLWSPLVKSFRRKESLYFISIPKIFVRNIKKQCRYIPEEF